MNRIRSTNNIFALSIVLVSTFLLLIVLVSWMYTTQYIPSLRGILDDQTNHISAAEFTGTNAEGWKIYKQSERNMRKVVSANEVGMGVSHASERSRIGLTSAIAADLALYYQSERNRYPVKDNPAVNELEDLSAERTQTWKGRRR